MNDLYFDKVDVFKDFSVDIFLFTWSRFIPSMSIFHLFSFFYMLKNSIIVDL